MERGVLSQAAEGSCTEVCSADHSARSAEKFIRLHFSVIRVGSRGTFVLCTASSRCERIAGPGAAMCFRFSLKFRSCNVIATRKYTRSWSRSQAVRFQPAPPCGKLCTRNNCTPHSYCYVRFSQCIRQLLVTAASKCLKV